MYQRSSGLLCHITSLPGRHGVGDLGDCARQFTDWLRSANQHVWQVLPLGPVGAGDSPYDSRSSFAGNPMMISVSELTDDQLLDSTEVPGATDFQTDHVEFRRVEQWKDRLLRIAFERFQSRVRRDLQQDYEEFLERSHDWLDDFALYQSLRALNGGKAWYRWDEDIRLRRTKAMESARSELGSETEYHRFVQFLFDLQWKRLKSYAGERGISIMGDIPIYVALDSADVWANQDQFLLDEAGQPVVQAGVPPDLFTADGQLWGNPVYDWDRMAADGYRWWEQRLRRVLELTDIVRIDHFRGFAAGWQVPAHETTARIGEWVAGPGEAFFRAMEDRLGRMPIVVEDLGVITEDVEQMRDNLGYPGMKVLQFAFGDDSSNPYLPHNAVRNSMIYTGTHDNDTSRGWYESAPRDEKRFARQYLNGTDSTIERDMIRAAWSSVSVLACAPIQDLLGAGSEARMNVPGQARGNWAWRLADLDDLTQQAEWLRDLTSLYARDQPPMPQFAGPGSRDD